MKKHFCIKFLVLFSLLIGLQLMFTSVKALALTTNSNVLPPSNLAFQLTTPDDVKLTWSSVYGATGYNVYGITNGQLQLLGTTTSATYAFSNLAEGSYTYVVSTLSTDGESGPCAPIYVDIVYPDMSAPATLTNTFKNGNDIVLNWSASSYAQTYNIYQVTADGQKTLVNSISGLTYTIANAPAGTYSYAISAVNSLYGESPISASLQVNVVFPTMTAPSNLTYKIQNGNDVVLSWGSVSYANSYNVYELIDGKEVIKTTVSSTSATLPSILAGDHTYVIHSVSTRFGESPVGSQISITLVAPTMLAPANLIYSLANGTDISLKWSAATYATAYNVYQIIDGQKVLKSTVTGTTVTYANMPNGAYLYEVDSYSDRFGESPIGSQISVTLGDVTMAPPANLTYTINNGNDLVLSWGIVPNATSYKVYQIINGQKILKSTVTGTTVTYVNMPVGDYSYEVHSYSTSFGESVDGSQLIFTLVFPSMQPPANVVQTIKSATSFALGWDASSYATSYKIYQIINGQKVLKSTVTGTTVTYTNMTPGDYTFEVHSYSTRFGESVDGSTLVMTLNGQTMDSPTNLTYSIANGNDITLKWTAASYATSYKIYQVIGGQNVLQKTVTSTSATFTNMPSGDYDYVVTSISTLLGESPNGAEVTFSFVIPTMTAPNNLTYKIQNGNNVVLSWNAVTYASSYKIYEIVDGQEVFKTTVTSLTATISNVAAGNHTYVVHSVSTRFGESQEGSQISVTLNQTMMIAPTNLTYSIVNGNDITLRWTASTYATSYNIYQVIDGQNVLQKTVTSTSATFTNMLSGDYDYVVTSVSSTFGESPSGAEVTLSLVVPTMEAPSNLAFSIQNGNDVVLTWGSVPYATSYNIYELTDGQEVLKATASTTTVRLSNVAAGDYTYVVHSVSTRFGESQTESQVSLTLTLPIMAAPANLTYSITSGNNITLKWDAAIYATSYNVYQVSNGQKTFLKTVTSTSAAFINMPAGEYTYEVYSYSTRFNESPIGSTTNFELIWPVVQPPVLKDTIYNINNITLSWLPSSWANEYRVYEITGGTRQLLYKGTALSYKIYNLSEGTHNYEVTAYNTRFGESDPSNRITEIIIYPDMQSPTTTLQLLDSTSASISWNFITYANGYNVYEIIDGKPVLLIENLNNLSYQVNNLSYKDHQYYVTSFSNSFGESQPSNIVIAKLIVDTEPPITTSDAPLNWVNQSPLVVNLSARDNETGVANTYYSINDSTFTEGNSITVDKEGLNKISFYSVDKVGNKEEVQTIYVKIDKTAPITTTNAPENWSKEDVTVNLTAADAQSGVAKTFYSIDGSDYLEGTSFTIKDEGIHKINFYSVDVAGNIEAANLVEVKIDKTAPVITMDLNNEYKLDTALLLTYMAKDNLSGIVDEKMVVFSPNDTTGSIVENNTVIQLDKPGVYRVTITVTNAAGLSTIIEKQFEVYIPATIEVTSKVIKGNNGIFTVRVDIPVEYGTQGYDLNTATLNGVKALTSNNGYYNQAKLGQFKFERSDFNWTPSEMIVEFRCYINGYLVIGQTTVKVQK
jgi:large repetitive protein